HLLPDLIGNPKAFSGQSVRGTKCRAKYRRVPLRGRCLECSGNLTLTVHESSVKKYLEISKRISQQFEVSNYLRQRSDLIEEAITSLCTNDRTQDLKLDDFFYAAATRACAPRILSAAAAARNARRAKAP